MNVVNIVDGISRIMAVPDSYIQCSVSGEFRPPEEFQRDGVQVRTNCIRTYNMSSDDMNVEQQAFLNIQKTADYKKLVKVLCDQNDALANSILVSTMIAWLRELVSQNPNARICMTQDGYYADGKFAQIHAPDVIDSTNNLYSIGHSYQNY